MKGKFPNGLFLALSPDSEERKKRKPFCPSPCLRRLPPSGSQEISSSGVELVSTSAVWEIFINKEEEAKTWCLDQGGTLPFHLLQTSTSKDHVFLGVFCNVFCLMRFFCVSSLSGVHCMSCIDDAAAISRDICSSAASG